MSRNEGMNSADWWEEAFQAEGIGIAKALQWEIFDVFEENEGPPCAQSGVGKGEGGRSVGNSSVGPCKPLRTLCP